jgi:steroid 5-alpha reductase family enzyme
MLAGLLASAWGSRLSSHLYWTRVHNAKEDGRYQQLRKEWGEKSSEKFSTIFIFQSALAVSFSIPFYLACTQPGRLPFLPAAAAVVLGMGSILGEAEADRQLHEHKHLPGHRCKVLDTGLWEHCRHPNYLCDWGFWCSVVLLSWGRPNRMLLASTFGPLAMLVLLFGVKIPLNEAQALRSKGEAYIRYQNRTSSFIPWPLSLYRSSSSSSN